METNVLGRELARVRKMKKISQEQLGKKIGLTKSSICKIEKGRTNLTWEDAAIIMEAMGEVLPMPYVEVSDSASQTQKEQLLISVVEWYASENGLTLAEAYKYLLAFKGIDYLIQNYRYEQTLPKETILQDVSAVCRNNGGKI